MSKNTTKLVMNTLVAAVLTTFTLGALASDPPIVRGQNLSPWQDGVHGGAYDFKMSSGTSKLYSFGVTPRGTYDWGLLSVTAAYGIGPGYVDQSVQNFVFNGTSFVSKTGVKQGGNTLMYIHGASVYFIHPDAPFSQKYKDDLLTPTAYSKKLALSNFTGLATASVVHMNKRSLLWLNGTNLYSGGPAYDTGSGASTLVSSNITEAKSFGPFLFVKNNSGKVFFVAETGQNKIVEIVGATDLSFLSDKTKAYMVSGDTIQLVGIGSTNNYNFKYTDISISSGSVVAVVASDTTVAGNGYQTAYNSTYTSGSNTYSGPNMPGAWVVDSTGNLAHTNDVFGTPENGVPRAWEFSCIDTPTWSASMTNNNDINSVYAGTNAVAASYLGGYGNLSVGMMSDGTLKFAGSNSSGRVIGGHRQTSTKLINGYGWPYTNQSLGFCNPTELPVDSIPGPNNVVASKAAFNNKVNVTWDAKSAGTVYSVRRIGTGVDQVVATALADTTFEDVSVTKGANKSEAISYAVSANSASGIYQTRTGSPYYYPSSAWSGCNASSALSDNCVGFRANAPTGATNNSVDVTAGVSQQVISTTGINVTDIDSPYDTFVFSLASQPTLGSVSVNGSGQFLYTPNSGFLGVDSFNTVVTDKAGNTKNVPIQVNVLCPAPTISTITFPVSYDAFVAQLGSVQYTASACSETVSTKVEITSSGSSEILSSYSSNFTGMLTGSNLTKQFAMVNLPSGSYTMTVTVGSEKVGLPGNNNSATRTVNFQVKPVGTYTLATASPTYTDDDLIAINVTATAGSCPIVSKDNARATRGCYVEWKSHPLLETSSTGPANLSGFAQAGLLQLVTAEVRKFDSNLVDQLGVTITKEINVTQGLPTTLKSVSVPSSIVRQLDAVNLVFERDAGYACTIYTTTSAAASAVSAGNKACLIEATLPSGLAWKTSGSIPTISGRMTSDPGTVSIPYTLTKILAGRDPVVMVTGSLSLNVVEPQITLSLVKNKTSFAANASNAAIEAKLSASVAGAKTCTLTTSQSEAATSFSNATALKCYVAWDVVPAGLVPDTTAGTLPKLKGVPTVLGDNAVKFSVYAVQNASAGGFTSSLVSTLEDTISVIEMTPLSSVFSTPKEGLITLSGNASQKILVGDTGEVGQIEIVSGDFATVKMTVQETGYAPQVVTGLVNGDKRSIFVTAGAKGAWINRSVNVKFEYENLSVATETSKTLDLIQLPAQRMVIKASKPTVSPLDSSPFSFTAKMGVLSGATLNYAASTGGVWKAALYVKQGLNMVPITSESTVDASGNVTWDNLTPSDFVDVEFFAGATWVKPEGSSLTIEDKKIFSDTGVTLTFLKGIALTGETLIGRARGAAPLRQTLDLRISSDSLSVLKSVDWYISTDNQNYTPLGVSGRQAVFTFNDGGTYYVKGQMTNKYSNIASFTEPVSFVAVQSYKVSLTGDNLVRPGTDLTQSVVVKNSDDTPVDSSNLNIVWEATDENGVKTTFNDVETMSLQSNLPKKYTVKVRVKGKSMDANNPESWFEAVNSLSFFTPTKPFVNVTGPRTLEIGTTGEFKAFVRTPWDSTAKTSLLVKGKWTLPDGVTFVADESVLNHLALAENGKDQTVKYTAWIDGMETETTNTMTYKFLTTNYVFPTHKLSAVIDTTFAPAYVKLTALPATSTDATLMRGKKFTYTWTLPTTDFAGGSSGYGARGIADKPGTYPFSVVISDSRGNSQTLDYSLTLETTTPWVLSMKMAPGLKYNRDPMTYVIKPILSGGHPKDRVKDIVISVDGVDVPTNKGMTKILTISSPGTHEVGLRVTSVMGASASTSQTVDINENTAPVCTLTATWDTARKSARVTPKCADPDGKLKRVVWFVDGVESPRSSSNYYFYPTAQKTSAEIKVQVFDDSGDYAEATTTVTK